MQIGTDIVHITRFAKTLEDSGQAERVFAPEEMTESQETMAGKFAAKEAYFKAKQKKGDWRSIMVLSRADGAPYLVCGEQNVSLSISHDGEYAIAVVLIS